MTFTTLQRLTRVRRERRLDFVIRLQHVIMEPNLQEACEVARFAQEGGMQVFYQPIEQNYDTPEDARWFETSTNWLKDTARAIEVVERLVQLKRSGLPIANTYSQLEAMNPYFRDPDSLRVSTQAHSAHERRQSCVALTNLQIQANGDVTDCTAQPRIGDASHLGVPPKRVARRLLPSAPLHPGGAGRPPGRERPRQSARLQNVGAATLRSF